MSSSFLSGGRAAAYRLESLDLDLIKSPSSTSWISNSSSPSSTLSESSHCPLAISTRKPRTPRKRPNQTYNEAAAILSTAYPKLFPAKHLANLSKLTKSILNKSITFQPDSSDLLMPFRAIDPSSFLLQRPDFSEKLQRGLGPGPFEKSCRSPGEIESDVTGLGRDDGQEDFDADSIILDEEIGEGIDCFMGNSGAGSDSIEGFDIYKENNNNHNSDDMYDYKYNCNFAGGLQVSGFCYGYPVGLGFEIGQWGVRKETRNVDGGDDWWRFPSVSVAGSNPITAKSAPSEKKKTKKEVAEGVEAKKEDLGAEGGGEELGPRQSGCGLLLKLNYEGVQSEWSNKASPFAGEGPVAEGVTGNDVQARLAQIDLFSDNGGIREASVLRYKEKRRNRLFSKKIRYQVRKVNADRRPRMKGRFVRTPNNSSDD